MTIQSKPLKYEGYVVLKKTSQDLPKGHWTYIAMINRSKSKQHWWTIDANMAMVFNLKVAAERKAKSLKYGPCKAVPFKDFAKYVGREFWKETVRGVGLTNMIADKVNQWHDDDWDEGSNYD